MATGPTGPVITESELEEMRYEGSRLVHDLGLADRHIDVLEKENKKLKEVIYDLKCECAVFEAERDQADEKVNDQDKKLLTLTQERDDLLEEVSGLKTKLQEWEDFEGWRQGRWVMVQDELKRLRAEVASLKKEKNEVSPAVSSS